MDWPAKIKRKRRRTTNSPHDLPRYPNLAQDLAIPPPEPVGVADITGIRLRCEAVYLAVIRDVFTRGLRGWYLSCQASPQLLR